MGKIGDRAGVIWVDNVVIVPRKTTVTRSKRPHLHFLRNMTPLDNIGGMKTSKLGVLCRREVRMERGIHAPTDDTLFHTKRHTARLTGGWAVRMLQCCGVVATVVLIGQIFTITSSAAITTDFSSCFTNLDLNYVALSYKFHCSKSRSNRFSQTDEI
jgi:hypothetical protein